MITAEISAAHRRSAASREYSLCCRTLTGTARTDGTIEQRPRSPSPTSVSNNRLISHSAFVFPVDRSSCSRSMCLVPCWHARCKGSSRVPCVRDRDAYTERRTSPSRGRLLPIVRSSPVRPSLGVQLSQFAPERGIRPARAFRSPLQLCMRREDQPLPAMSATSRAIAAVSSPTSCRGLTKCSAKPAAALCSISAWVP